MFCPQNKDKRVPQLKDLLDYNADDFEKFVDRVEGYPESEKPPGTFSEALKMHMKYKDVTVEELADRVNLSTKTVGKMRNDDEYTPEIENVVAVCIGLHLMPAQSYKLVELAGYKFKASKSHRLYCYLLDTAYMNSVDECNAFLSRAGVKAI